MRNFDYIEIRTTSAESNAIGLAFDNVVASETRASYDIIGKNNKVLLSTSANIVHLDGKVVLTELGIREVLNSLIKAVAYCYKEILQVPLQNTEDIAKRVRAYFDKLLANEKPDIYIIFNSGYTE